MATMTTTVDWDFAGLAKPINVGAPVNNGDVMRKDEFGINYNKLGVSGNPDFASIASLSTALSAAYGGTGQLGGYTAGDILYASGASTLSKLAKPSTAGQVLTGGTTPAWVSGVTLLSTATASSSATIDFTWAAGTVYREMLVVMSNVTPATTTVTLQARTSADGSAWDSGANNYTWTNMDYVTGSFSGTDTKMIIAGTTSNLVTTANNSVSGEFRVFDPGASTFGKCTWLLAATSGGQTRAQSGAGNRASAGVVRGVRFFMSSGNIASGEFRLYGLAG